ncbi:hypothetical protein DFR50_12239 [Roseiarcus fermentans]|uniref:Uncharacterized protein n=1 Tax=Roseiarcus fermentans TaxID=1473586 RepID=A0A366F3G8_9HYPH|nr:hypothetical protein DFR50_12239 [Roseiarcus fermentans]
MPGRGLTAGEKSRPFGREKRIATVHKGSHVSTIIVSRRGLLASVGALAAAGLAGCNTTQTAPAAGATPAPAPVGYRIASVVVDTTPLVGQSGNPTAQWAQDALPGALAQALSSHMAPGDPSGGTLSVVVNSIYLGGGGPADPDRMRGVATFNGQQIPIRTTSTWISSPVDNALVEQSNQNRVNALAVSFAYLLKKKLRRA